jgi:hypothetical protein
VNSAVSWCKLPPGLLFKNINIIKIQDFGEGLMILLNDDTWSWAKFFFIDTRYIMLHVIRALTQVSKKLKNIFGHGTSISINSILLVC